MILPPSQKISTAKPKRLVVLILYTLSFQIAQKDFAEPVSPIRRLHNPACVFNGCPSSAAQGSWVCPKPARPLTTFSEPVSEQEYLSIFHPSRWLGIVGI